MRQNGTSFERLFGGAAPPQRSKPSVQELFAATMRGELSTDELIQSLEMSDIRLTPAAHRLLFSVEAESGTLSYVTFQRALQDHSMPTTPSSGAGMKTMFHDQAKAIISDNAGKPVPLLHPAQTGETMKYNTDISADPFIRRQVAVERAQKGPFSSNPVIRTNHPSEENPLLEKPDVRDPNSVREVANNATRMYLGGQLNREEFVQYIGRFGVRADGELCKLMKAHEEFGSGSFHNFSRVLQREIASAAA